MAQTLLDASLILLQNAGKNSFAVAAAVAQACHAIFTFLGSGGRLSGGGALGLAEELKPAGVCQLLKE
jgi:hypothetical protein